MAVPGACRDLPRSEQVEVEPQHKFGVMLCHLHQGIFHLCVREYCESVREMLAYVRAGADGNGLLCRLLEEVGGSAASGRSNVRETHLCVPKTASHVVGDGRQDICAVRREFQPAHSVAVAPQLHQRHG